MAQVVRVNAGYSADPRIDAYIGGFRSGSRRAISKRALSRMFQTDIANNRAGGWRKLKSQTEH
ncbi:MAG: hypothetical protein LC797_14990 [Chloroflexi bacterium]|nr:hypothetical protein [Chloroflexota bacterium]